jgi:hypothetical protein
VRVFKTKWFSRFAKKNGISDAKLKNIVTSLEDGLWDADLGGDVYKIRIARPGAGKAGGYRTIVFFKSENSAFFMYGFAKSDMDNIGVKELQELKDTAKEDFALTDVQLNEHIKTVFLLKLFRRFYEKKIPK